MSSTSSVLSIPEVIGYFRDEVRARGERRKVPNWKPNIISRSNSQPENTPRCVSIGPIHGQNPKLQRMEDHKWWLVEELKVADLNVAIEACFDGLRDLEKRARETYPQTIDIKSRDFLVMLFLDAFFIIIRLVVEKEKNQPENQTILEPEHEVFLCSTESRTAGERTSQQLFNFNESRTAGGRTIHQLFNFNEITMRDIDTDLIMLDNQIPFFILEYVSGWLKRNVSFFKSFDLYQQLPAYFHISPRLSNLGNISHLLHFLHSSSIPENQNISQISGRKDWIPSATELKEFGIEFKLNESARSFLDIQFKDGTIQIPKILFTNAQRLKLQNLVDFEQSNLQIVTHFSNIVAFFCYLLCNEKDVRILSLQGIIENRFGSHKEVHEFFRSLQQRCIYLHGGTFLDELFVAINNYQQSKRKRWKAIFLREYCSTPWVTLTVIGAIVLFLLTFLQTFFAVYSFFHPPN